MDNTVSITIRPMSEFDREAVLQIYEAGIHTRQATFEQVVPGWEEWDTHHRQDCRLAAVLEEEVIGWAALSNVSGRCVYSGVAEVSIYIHPQWQGKGVGSRLMEKLIAESETAGIWTLQAGIFPENMSSIRLHEKFGFRIVGVRERIGKMEGIWRNVVLMERRSMITGV